MNKEPLYKTRGDIYAGETKTRVEVTSVEAELELLVGEKEAPEVYNADESGLFELGPFKVIFDWRHSWHSIRKAPTACHPTARNCWDSVGPDSVWSVI